MNKKILEPYEALYPVPVVLVTCVDKDNRPNIITIAWVGVVCSSPPCVSISVRPSRHSFGLINQTKEFVINIPGEKHLMQTDYCGITSGRNTDKFKQTKFTAVAASKVKPPLIKECPVNIECRLKSTLDLGAHHMFVAEVVAINADEAVLNSFGEIDYSKTHPIVYNQGEYWTLNKRIGEFGISRKMNKR